jgi:hypothetical protein
MMFTALVPAIFLKIYICIDSSICQNGLEHPIRNIQGTVSALITLKLLLILGVDLVQVILDQKDRDDNLGHLLEVMSDAYAFVLEAEPMKKIESHNRVLLVMVQQTTECSYFIREYATTQSFSMSLSVPHNHKISPPLSLIEKRVLEHILSGADNRIKQFEDKFKELRSAFQGRAVLQTEITVLRILDIVESQGQHVSLHTRSDLMYE